MIACYNSVMDKIKKFQINNRLTPIKVAMRRTPPVIHASVSLTSATSAIAVELDEVFTSSNKRREGLDTYVTLSILCGSEESALLKRMIATNFPAHSQVYRR